MNFVGYYPGIDFTDKSQFGRLIHTKKFINNYESNSESDCCFILGNKGDLEGEKIRGIGLSNSTLSKVLRDIIGFILLLIIVLQSDQRVVVYSRDSPYLSKLLIGLLPRVRLVIEVNGLPAQDKKKIKKALYDHIRRSSRNKASLLIAVSDNIGNKLRIKHTTPVEVIENGVDTDTFTPTIDSNDGNEWTICYVGGLQSWQRIDRMLSVVSNMDTQSQFLLVGGTKEKQDELHDRIEEYELEEQVTFVGKVAHSEVPEYINKAKVCFGPFSKKRLASPMKIYEYLSCEKPVVLLNDVGLEYVDEYPGVHRLTTSLTDEEIANKIEEIIQNGQRNRAGRKYVIENHSWPAVTSKVESAIQKYCI